MSMTASFALAKQRLQRANELLRECKAAIEDLMCDPSWVVLHNHGWKVLREMPPRIEAHLSEAEPATAEGERWRKNVLPCQEPRP
jgi:hypothetical protein